MNVRSKPRILVVEPDAAIRGFLEIVLRRDGFEAVAVAHGRAAVNALARGSYTAYIVDITLGPSTLDPGSLRGIGFLRHLQREHPAQIERVVILSALPPHKVTFDLPKCCRFLEKPFDIEALRTAISDCAAADALAS